LTLSTIGKGKIAAIRRHQLRPRLHGDFEDGSEVTLTAKARAGWEFKRWRSVAVRVQRTRRSLHDRDFEGPQGYCRLRPTTHRRGGSEQALTLVATPPGPSGSSVASDAALVSFISCPLGSVNLTAARK
jgi:hypothetical protein